EVFLPGLKKLGYTVKSYDNYAAPVAENTAGKVAVTKSAQEIIAGYLTAIGGETELKKVTSLLQTGDFEVQGQKLNATIRYMHPNLESTEISMNGTTVMKQVFNGTTGFQSQM